MATKHKYRFPNNRRVIRRQLYEASFGRAATIYGALVTLAAFFALWIVIMRCIVEDDPHRWMLNTLETGNYAIEQLELYRIENDGNLPEGLDSLGFRYSGYRNLYSIRLPRHGFIYGIEYLRLTDTSYYVGFELPRVAVGQYLSTERKWRVIEFEKSNYRHPRNYEGLDVSPLFLYEYRIDGCYDTLEKQLAHLIDSNATKNQQYMLTILGQYDTISSVFTENVRSDADSVQKVVYNAVFHTFEPSLYTDTELFAQIVGFFLLKGHTCFIVDKTWFSHRHCFERMGKGSVFSFPSDRGCVGGEKYYYLDIDASLGGRLEIKGVRVEE